MNVFIRHSSNKTLNGVYKHLTNTVYYNRSKRLYFRRYHNKYVITKTLNESLNFLAYYDISSCKFFAFVRGCYKFEIQTEIEFDEWRSCVQSVPSSRIGSNTLSTSMFFWMMRRIRP